MKNIFISCFVIFLLASLIGCANDVSVVKNAPKIADSLDITTEQYSEGTMVLSPDGTKLALWQGTSLKIFETSSGKILSESNDAPQTNSESYCEFSIDNKKVLLSAFNLSAFNHSSAIYYISEPLAIRILTIPDITYAHISDDGLRVIAISEANQPATIRVISAVNGSLEKELHPQKFYGYGVIFKRQENEVVYFTPEYATNTIVWSIDSDQEVSRFSISMTPDILKSSEDGSIIAFHDLNADTYIEIHSTQPDTAVYSVNLKKYGRRVYTPIAFSNEFFYIPTVLDSIGSISSVNILNGDIVRKWKFRKYESAWRVTVSRFKTCVAVQMSDGLIRLWRI